MNAYEEFVPPAGGSEGPAEEAPRTDRPSQRTRFRVAASGHDLVNTTNASPQRRGGGALAGVAAALSDVLRQGDDLPEHLGAALLTMHSRWEPRQLRMMGTQPSRSHSGAPRRLGWPPSSRIRGKTNPR